MCHHSCGSWNPALTLERELFEAILQNPDDIAPRLVYADWCDEQGDPRGEFIRIQCELAEYEGLPIKVRHLREREAQLWEKHRRAWNGEIHRRLAATPLRNQVDSRHGLIRGWEYHRGFVEYAVAEARAFLEYPEALFKIGPLRELRILHAEDHTLAIMQSSHLGLLSEVELSMPSLHWTTAIRFIERCRRPDQTRIEIHPVSCLSGPDFDGSYGIARRRVARDIPEAEREILAFSYFDEPRPIPTPVAFILAWALIAMLFFIPLKGCWLD